MNKLTFDHLEIEVTRRCNMACPHCMRGEAQDLDIDKQHIDDLLDQTEAIGFLLITGGEPLLNIDMIEYIADGIQQRGILLLGMEIITNGSTSSKRLINIIKWYKKIVDVSREYSTEYEDEYDPLQNTDGCVIGVSLDRYHSDHDKCLWNYERYKEALKGYADVIKIMQGNAPMKLGRGLCLPEACDASFMTSQNHTQTVEILSKDHTPVCEHYDSFRLAHPNQKVVCCGILLNVLGNIMAGAVDNYSYEQQKDFPIICTASQPIWEAIIRYNEGRFPCTKWRKESIFDVITDDEIRKQILRREEQMKSEECQNELGSKERRQMALMLAKAHIHGAQTIQDAAKYAETYSKDNKKKKPLMADYEALAVESSKHDYTSKVKSTELTAKEVIQDANWAISESKSVRCPRCQKVIIYENKLIHCKPGPEYTDKSYICDYCGYKTFEFELTR